MKKIKAVCCNSIAGILAYEERQSAKTRSKKLGFPHFKCTILVSDTTYKKMTKERSKRIGDIKL